MFMIMCVLLLCLMLFRLGHTSYISMKGLWLENKTISFREDLPLPEKKKEGDVLVKVLRAAICSTDLELIKGYYPYTGILGHEFVGRVDDETAPEHLRGKIVAGEINAACHNCWYCDSNIPTHCANRTVMGIVNHWGTMAEYVVLPKENLHIIPDGIALKEACFVEPLAAAMQIHAQVNFAKTDKVAVIGDGKLGLLISQAVAMHVDNLTVFGRHTEKLSILEKRGIKTCLNIDESFFGKFDKVVECTGNKEVLKIAIDLVRPRGTLIMKSTHHGDASIDTAKVVVNELTLVGSRCGPFDQAILALANNQVDVMSLFAGEYPLAECVKAIEHASAKGTLKIQLVCD